MDTESRLQQLSREIDEINALLEEWQITRDPGTLWAIYILEYCLERSKRELRNLLH
jgi:hypothetical protein